jgi:peptidoglycan/xylan/chitin deacetylase (PgdA/CDA1 family)
LIESDMITATLRCLSGIEGETGRLREKSRPGSTRDGKSGKDLAQTPWVNRYLDLLLDTIGQGCARIGIPLIQKWYWPGCKPFAASLSHDVDRTRRREPFLLASNALRSLRFLSRLRVGQAGRRLTEIGQLLVGHEDPLANFWRWLDLERKHGFRSTFFFLGGPRWRRYGARYDLKAPETRQIIDMIAAQGWEVGLHGSYYASCDRRCLEREKRELEAIVAAPVRGHRQHYLHLRVPDSWSAQEAAGLVYDASYGYRFKAGFRAGMCFPFFPYNVEAERCSRVLELPLIFMDSNYRSVLGKQGWQLICPLLETVQRHHGLITFNFHYCGIHERSYPGWFELYARLLDCLREQDAFVAPGAEIARWWDQRNHLQFVDEKRTPEGTTWTLRAGKRICDVCLRVCGCDVRRGARVTGLVDYHTSTEGQTMWIGIDELAPDTTVEIQVMYTPQNRSLSEQGAAR